MTLIIWSSFLLLIAFVLFLDLGVFHKKSHIMKLPEALTWTTVWVILALLFNLFIYFLYGQNWLGWTTSHSHQLTGQQAALQFFTGYIVEKSLSVDNIFVIAMIFSFLKVPAEEQHRVLFWGILGAVVMRGLMIALGIALIDRFDWIVYIFGLLLLASAVKMLIVRHDNLDPDKNIVVRMARRIYPISDQFDGNRFFTIKDGKRMATPLFLALVLVESTDVMFAVDSIPAILAITSDPFLVFTSNVFAILGLRALYFALAGLMDRFRYLKMSLVFLLAYIGVKMLLSHHYPIPNVVSLAIIGGILFVGILASILAGKFDTAALMSPLAIDLEKMAKGSYRQGKRAAILMIGATMLLIGVIMLALPGPGLFVIFLGLGVLAIEFVWAKRWLVKVRASIEKVRSKLSKKH